MWVKGTIHLEYTVRDKKINSEVYAKTPERLRQKINRVCRGEKLKLVQQDNATSHTDAATSAAIQSIEFEVVPHPPYRSNLAQYCLRNISKEFISHMKNFKRLREMFSGVR
jgi:hypothetical protein